MERSTDMGRQLRPAATAPFAAGLAVLAALLAGCGGQPPPSVPQNAPQVGPAVVTALPDAEAYTTNDGSIVLRRDTKVMLVDVTQLPGTFGNPPSPRGDAARLIMKAVLNCWVG